MNKKLFKKLNEQIEINDVKEYSDISSMNEAEIEKAEKALIFECATEKIIENLKVEA